MKHRSPSLTALRAFEAATRLGSFKAAAGELNVTPSAVSHQIKLLEHDLGCVLMRRSRAGLTLTEAGRRFSATVHKAFADIASAAETLRSESTTVLSLQAYSTFAVRWLLDRLGGYERTPFGSPVKLVTSQADLDLSSGAADACVMIGAPSRSEVDYIYLFSSHVFPVCSPDYLARARPIETPSDLSRHALLQVYPSEEDWAVWLAAVDAAHIDVAGDTRFDSYDHALNAAARGIGVALAIEPFAEADLAEGRLVEVFPGRRVRLPRDWFFASLRARRDEPKIAAFRRWLLEEIAADPTIFSDPNWTARHDKDRRAFGV